MRRHFLSFASSDMRPSLDRIRAQAAATGVFDTVTCIDETGLDPAFRAEFAHRLSFGSRGYGYWCWKPQLCLQRLRDIPDGDVVLYADAGCHIHAQGTPQLALYIEAARLNPDGFLVFQHDPSTSKSTRDPQAFREECWTKEDLFAHLRLDAAALERRSDQIAATVFAFRASPRSRAFFNDWLAIYRADFALADDTPSALPCAPCFKEHRHDQSIFSLLAKSMTVERRSFFELKPDDYTLPLAPEQIAIVAARDRQMRFLSRKRRQWDKFARKLRRLFP